VIELAAFAGPASSAAMERIRGAQSLPEMAAIADNYFAGLIERQARRRGDYPAALEQWLLDPGDLDLDRLIGMMDVSRRQTDRLAKQYFGASPKLLQRKYRALRAAGRLLAGNSCWRAAAGDAFYDQSHFIKEFRAFVGVTPLEFLNNQAALAAAVREQRALAVAAHPLAEL
jgi:AraC-like DNA-binding protein